MLAGAASKANAGIEERDCQNSESLRSSIHCSKLPSAKRLCRCEPQSAVQLAHTVLLFFVVITFWQEDELTR